jgi:HEAT repeat protein
MASLEDLFGDLKSGVDEVAEKAVPQIVSYGDEAIEILSKLSTDPNPDHRWWALRTLSEIKNEDITEYLIEGLNDENISVQQCAAIGLRERPDLYALPELIGFLSHEDKLLVRLIGDALIVLGKDAAAELLKVVQHQNSKQAKLQAVRALAFIGDHSSITALFKLLDGDSMLLEYWASLGLERMGVGMTFFNPGS